MTILAMQPIPAESPIGGPFWTVVVPALLFAGLPLSVTWGLTRLSPALR